MRQKFANEKKFFCTFLFSVNKTTPFFGLKLCNFL